MALLMTPLLNTTSPSQHAGQEIASSLEPAYAGFWVRVIAKLIDLFILLLILLGTFLMATLILLFLQGWEPLHQEFAALLASAKSGKPMAASETLPLTFLVVILLQLPIHFIYYVYFTASSFQGTPGKRWTGIYVIRTDGQKVGLGSSLARYMGAGISQMVFPLGHLMVAFTPGKRALHDFIARTYVVYGHPVPQSPPAIK